VTLTKTETAEISKNIAGADSYVYVGISLPPGTAAGVVIPAIFSRNNEMGSNNGAAANLVNAMTAGNGFPAGFGQLITPGNQLYAKLDPTAAPNTQKVLVAAVVF
jgi:hypothetical protein